MGPNEKTVLTVVIALSLVFLGVSGSHFRGGTISWKSEGGLKVHFYFRLGWTFGGGPGCKPNLIGQLVTGFASAYWTCQSNNNCNSNQLSNVNYYCTGANKAENWEQGKNDFVYTFPNTGPFTIGYSSSAWITLSNKKGGGIWNVATTVDLRTRSDTATPNSSPESLSKPMYYVQLGCEVHLKLPVIDPDNDKVRCRWAVGNECGSVCSALPFAQLDEETCTLNFNTTLANQYTQNGVYAVALMIEDYPRVPMTLGSSTKKTPNDVLSSVPLQFLVTTIPQQGSCDSGPRFVPPTPAESKVLTFEEGDKVKVDLYTDNNNDTSAKANRITASGPVTLTLTPVIPDVNRTDTYTTTVVWQTAHKDVGNHIVCASVTNSKGKTGQQRCFTIQVVPKGCKSSPCQNSGKCVANMGKHTCICRPGFTGQNCQVNVDDCVPNSCPSGTFCLDGVNAYTCPNITITTTTTQMTTTEKNYTGMCPLEYEHCNCSIKPNRNDRGWMGLSRRVRDILDVSFGFPIGLILSVFTFFCLMRPCERKCYDRRQKRRSRKKQERYQKLGK